MFSSSFCAVAFIGALFLKDIPQCNTDANVDDKQNKPKLMTTSTKRSGNEKKGKHYRFLEIVKSSFSVKVFHIIEWDLLLNPYFTLVALNDAFVGSSVMTFMPQLREITAEKGLSLEKTADILTLRAMGDIIARIFQGLLGDIQWLRTILPWKLILYMHCFPKSFTTALGLSNIIGAVAALLLGPVMDKLKEF